MRGQVASPTKVKHFCTALKLPAALPPIMHYFQTMRRMQALSPCPTCLNLHQYRHGVWTLPSLLHYKWSIVLVTWIDAPHVTKNPTFQQKGATLKQLNDKQGLAIVVPDTSPWGGQVPDNDKYNFGQGAGFYIDATEEPFKTNYNMHTYIMTELPAFLKNEFGLDGPKSISGHSMGGHGALTIAFKNPSEWTSAIAFAPICNPTNCPWGEKAFEGYLGFVEAGNAHDATCLLQECNTPIVEFDDILIDQGADDEFLYTQLKPEALEAAADKCGQTVTINMQDGYNHSYHFISSFIKNHINFHASHLLKAQKALTAESEYGFSETQGKPIQCKAMVAHEPKKPLMEENIIVD
jgi:S-formylglutathione hydrolase